MAPRTPGSPAPPIASSAADWRELIAQAVAVLWPSLPDGPRWIESQVHCESGGNPAAESPAGALGLLQLMPGTADEMGCANPYDPGENLRAGIGYLKRQYGRLDQVRTPLDRLRWSFASYNCGRGYVQVALQLAELDQVHEWWTWDASARYLADPRATVRGRRADWRQVVGYVRRIEAHYRLLGGRA